MRLQRVLVTLLAVVISIFTTYVVVGQQFAFGPVLLSVSNDHGLHLADVPILGLWVLGMGACVVLWIKPPSA